MTASRCPTRSDAGGGFIPKGAKNVEVAKDFMKYFMQPKVLNENLKAGLGRWVPAMPEIVKDDPSWLDPKIRSVKPYVTRGVLEPTMPVYEGSIPAWGQVAAEQLWGQAHADVIKNGMTPAGGGGQGVQAQPRRFSRRSRLTHWRGEHGRHTAGTRRLGAVRR